MQPGWEGGIRDPTPRERTAERVSGRRDWSGGVCGRNKGTPPPPGRWKASRDRAGDSGRRGGAGFQGRAPR